ncbi:MAG: septum formation inhibitor Maf [Tenacibaculum sp.]|nr:septum formation inhibitor Maf [Tenacibaculum sp.]
MKFIQDYKLISKLFFSFVALTLLQSCSQSNAMERSKKTRSDKTQENFSNRKVNSQTKEYWFDGKAEISSYELNQIRYGEIHSGKASLIYVTEPFSKSSNTKADYNRESNISVLKLNSTKKFNTGIYPYSIMNSTFFPFEKTNTSLKIASSMQEWCGMMYTEMTNRTDLIFNHNSYFEGASFKGKKLKKNILEDDLWSLLRLNPELLPQGKQEIIPSITFLNLMHQEFKTYEAIAKIKTNTNNTSKTYVIEYPTLNRTLSVTFEAQFPHKVLDWTESYKSGYGNQRKSLTTTAKLIRSIKIDYWNKNKNKDSHLRDSLGF